MKAFLVGLMLFLGIIYRTGAQSNDKTGFFIWDEATSNSVIQDAISRGINSFRSRDLTILYTQPAWSIFKAYGNALDVMVAIPVYYTYTTTPVNLTALADSINKNPFIRRLQVYPKLQPGLMNPSELNPCNDWLTGYANEFETRIRQLDQMVTDKSVEILVAGQLGTPGCSDLTQIINTLYDIQSTGRSVGWGVTVYPYYYGTQDASLTTLTGDINGVLANLTLLAPSGKPRLPLRVIESGWPSECSVKATTINHCTFVKSAFDYSQANVKIYYFELQDFAAGWSECEKHFGLYNVSGIIKCPLILPVTWGSFEAEWKDEKIFITWSTLSERDNKTFNIERSEDGLTFLPIGSVVGSGNSSTGYTYQWIDYSPMNGQSYYRLHQIDYTGASSYSAVQTITIPQENWGRIFPNPASTQGTISIQLERDAILELYNNLGILVHKEELKKGAFVLSITGKNLKAGMYHFVLRSSTDVHHSMLVIR